LFVPATKLRIFQQNPQFFPPIDHHHFFLVPVSSTANGCAALVYTKDHLFFLGSVPVCFFVGEEEITVSQTMQNSKVLSMDVAGNSFFTPPSPDCITKRPTLRFLNFSFL
jgi:hypothetical protein